MSLHPKPQPRTLLGAPGMLGEKVFTVGTLSYTKGALFLLFSWLMWNDLCLMLMENVAPNLTPLLLHQYGASNREVSFFMSTLTGAFTIWINPVVSTWSDRYRSSQGRRRPFLLFATPFCAFFLGAIPFMPDFFNYLHKIPAFANFFNKHTSIGVTTFIGLGLLFYQIFNSVITAIFTYYFWDVVPEAVLGRFSALTKTVSGLANFGWNFFLFGLSEKHVKGVYVGVAALFLVAYLVSLWQVKEGDYPPPEKNNRKFWTVISSYFTDCYRPYYLWFIVANSLFQIGNLSGTFQTFFFLDQLHLTRQELGHLKSLPTLIMIGGAYFIGSLVDRVKPGRMLIVSVFVYGCVNVIGFFMLKGYWSLFIFMGTIPIIVCALGISTSVFTVEYFPRSKLGQFCSANATAYSITCMIVAPFVGRMFDWIKDYRYAFLWSASFYFLSVPLYLKAYLNWRRAQLITGSTDSQWQEPAEIAAVEAS